MICYAHVKKKKKIVVCSLRAIMVQKSSNFMLIKSAEHFFLLQISVFIASHVCLYLQSFILCLGLPLINIWKMNISHEYHDT